MLVKRLVVAAVATAAVTVVVSPFGGASAGAAHHAKGGSCSQGKLCVWSKPDADGKQLNFTKLGVSNKLAKRMNDDASSAINNRHGAVFLYDKRDGEGDFICLLPESKQNLVSFDNRASSSKLTRKDSCPV